MIRRSSQPVVARVFLRLMPWCRAFVLMLFVALAMLTPQRVAGYVNCDYFNHPCPDYYDPPLWPGCPSPPGSQPYTGLVVGVHSDY